MLNIRERMRAQRDTVGNLVTVKFGERKEFIVGDSHSEGRERETREPL